MLSWSLIVITLGLVTLEDAFHVVEKKGWKKEKQDRGAEGWRVQDRIIRYGKEVFKRRSHERMIIRSYS